MAAKETEAPDTAEIQGTDASDVPELLLNVPETGKLSDMTAAEIFALLSEHGVEYSSEIRKICRINELVGIFETDPYTPIVLDHVEYTVFIENVRQEVLNYYGLTDKADNPPNWNPGGSQDTEAPEGPKQILNVPETGKLSDMTEEEIFTYLSEHGVEYSDHIRENFNISAYIKDIEEAPYRPVLFDHPDYHFFCESVQQAVLEYYGLPLRLSDMDRDKLIEKLEELGVDLSDPEIAGYSELNELVASFELDPERDVVSEQPKLNVLFEQVREAVKAYYGDLLPLG